MTLLEQIQQEVQKLPPEKQAEVLDFTTFLRQRLVHVRHPQSRSLRQHPAFGSWCERKIDALHYQEALHAEWESPL
jgi:hypothetical protein